MVTPPSTVKDVNQHVMHHGDKKDQTRAGLKLAFGSGIRDCNCGWLPSTIRSRCPPKCVSKSLEELLSQNPQMIFLEMATISIPTDPKYMVLGPSWAPSSSKFDPLKNPPRMKGLSEPSRAEGHHPPLRTGRATCPCWNLESLMLWATIFWTTTWCSTYCGRWAASFRSRMLRHNIIKTAKRRALRSLRFWGLELAILMKILRGPGIRLGS